MFKSQISLDQYYDHKLTGPTLKDPLPIKITPNTKFNWDQDVRIKEDNCNIETTDLERTRPGDYQLSSYDPTYQKVNDNINRLDGKTHFQKIYRNSNNYVDDESRLILSELSNLRQLNQLYTRPYAGFFSGPGMPSLGHKDLESALQQGLLTNLRQKPCESSRGKTGYNFIPLPDFGNPQRTEHIILPLPQFGGVVRGGDNTRDYVRRIDYQKRCANQMNHLLLKKK